MMLTTTQTIILSLLRKNLNKDCIRLILDKYYLIDKDEIETSKIPRLFSSYEDIQCTIDDINNLNINNRFQLLLDINFFKEDLMADKMIRFGYYFFKEISIKKKLELVNLMSKVKEDIHMIKERLITLVSFHNFISIMGDRIVREKRDYYDYGIFYDNDMNMSVLQY